MREILKNLYGITDKSLDEKEFAFLENKFGTIPGKLREFYSISGCSGKIQNGQDDWITPVHYKNWKWLNDEENLFVLHENQGVCHAVILKEDLGKDDPPVYIVDDNLENPLLCAAGTEEFIKAALVYEAVFQFDYSSESFYYISDDEFEILKEKLDFMPYHLENWLFTDVMLFRYLSDGAAFVMGSEDNYQMCFGAASKETFDKLSSVLDSIGEEM